MDLLQIFAAPAYEPITCVDLHTAGMPTRIITSGYPALSGSLAEQKKQAANQHDHLRRRILYEPRGHSDMFGAILLPHTEHTDAQRAHMGVLYIHPSGYSNMCGHATIALGRFLVDTHDLGIFPQRERLSHNRVDNLTSVILHTPGGLVEITVPTNEDGTRSDPTRPVTFEAVPAYVLATELEIEIPPEYRWPQLGERDSVAVDISYCSAFSCHVSLESLGFPRNALRQAPMLKSLKFAMEQIKLTINSNAEYLSKLNIPGRSNEAGRIFGVMAVDKNWGTVGDGSCGVETGLYIFGDGHIDRSPTGSMAAARAAVAFRKGELKLGESWTYHSVVSNSSKASPGFTATVLREISSNGFDHPDRDSAGSRPLISRIKGNASYTGFHTLVVEPEDHLPRSGFLLNEL